MKGVKRCQESTGRHKTARVLRSMKFQGKVAFDGCTACSAARQVSR